MKNVADEEFVAKIDEIKKRYGQLVEQNEKVELNWDALYVSVLLFQGISGNDDS